MENAALAGDRPKTWLISWRAAMGRDLLADASVAERIRQRLLDAHRPGGRALLDYLLTPTEIHVLSSLPANELPGAVARAFANVTSRWVRELHGVVGPVFAGRYRALAIASEPALLNEVRMLAWRPVALGLCRTPTHYTYSALRTTLGLRRAMGFDSRPLLSRFGTTVPSARAVLRASIAKRPGPVEMHQWALGRGLLLATGNVGPAEKMAREVRGASAALVAASDSRSIEGALALIERWVAVRLGVSSESGLDHIQGAPGARARALVACFAVQLGLCPAAAVARYFGRAKATLSEQMAACHSRPADRLILATPVARLVEEAIELGGPQGRG